MGSTQSQKLPTSKVPGGNASGAARGSDFLSSSPLTDLPTPPARSLLATPSGNIMRDGLASGGLNLSAPVGPGAPNRPKDVFQVETVLNGSGFLSRAPGTRFGDDTASAIGQGQQRLNRDHKNTVGRRPLKIDSLINPDGPTQTANRGLARDVADQWRGFEQRRRPALPISPLPNPPTDNTIRLKRLQDAMTAEQTGELSRLADGLSKTRTPGAIAGDISRAINTDGLKAVAEFKMVRDQLAKIATPDQVRALDRAVMGGVSEDQRDQLEALLRPRKPEADDQSKPGQPPHRIDEAGRERKNINLNAGTDDGDGTPQSKGGADPDITIRMPEGQEGLSISVRTDASDEEKADALHGIMNALQTHKGGKDGSNDDLIKDVGEGVLSLVPGVGNVLSARDAYYAFQAAAKAYEKGDTSEAGLQAALGVVDAVGAIPGPGNLIKGAREIASLMVKGGKRLLKKNTPSSSGRVSPSTSPLGGGPEPSNPEKLSLKKSDHKPQSLSNEDARYFYNERVKTAKQRNAGIKDMKEGATDGHQIRNKERTLARNLMKDRKAVKNLERRHPNLTMGRLLKRAEEKGFHGEAAFEYIRNSAFKPNDAVNKKYFGK